MPAGYEKIRDKIYSKNLASGMKPQKAYDDAQAQAARIWNASNSGNPVGRSDAKQTRGKRK